MLTHLWNLKDSLKPPGDKNEPLEEIAKEYQKLEGSELKLILEAIGKLKKLKLDISLEAIKEVFEYDQTHNYPSDMTISQYLLNEF